MKQLTLARAGFERYGKTTRRAVFLAEMEPGTPIFPVPILGLVTGTEFEPREFFDNALPVALAGSLAAEPAVEAGLHANREDGARHLHAHREAERVKFANRP